MRLTIVAGAMLLTTLMTAGSSVAFVEYVGLFAGEVQETVELTTYYGNELAATLGDAAVAAVEAEAGAARGAACDPPLLGAEVEVAEQAAMLQAWLEGAPDCAATMPERVLDA